MKTFYLAAFVAATSVAALPGGNGDMGPGSNNREQGQSGDWAAWSSTSAPPPASTPAKQTGWGDLTCSAATVTLPAPPAVTVTFTAPPKVETQTVTTTLPPKVETVTVTTKLPPKVETSTVFSTITQKATSTWSEWKTPGATTITVPTTVYVTSVSTASCTTTSSWGVWEPSKPVTTTTSASSSWGAWEPHGSAGFSNATAPSGWESNKPTTFVTSSSKILPTGGKNY